MHTLKATSNTPAIRSHFARIPVGEITATLSSAIANTRFLRVPCWWRHESILVDGEGSVEHPGHPTWPEGLSRSVSPPRSSPIPERPMMTMVLDGGGVEELAASIALPGSGPRAGDRRRTVRGVVASLDRGVLFGLRPQAPTAVQRRVPAHTADLPTATSAMISSSHSSAWTRRPAEKGYAGPVVVCSLRYEPIAGHMRDPHARQISFPTAAKWSWRSHRLPTRASGAFWLSVVASSELNDRGQSNSKRYGTCCKGTPLMSRIPTFRRTAQ